MEKWPAEIGTLYLDVPTSMEKWLGDNWHLIFRCHYINGKMTCRNLAPYNSMSLHQWKYDPPKLAPYYFDVTTWMEKWPAEIWGLIFRCLYINGNMTRRNCRLIFSMSLHQMEMWPAEIGTSYFDVSASMEKWPPETWRLKFWCHYIDGKITRRNWRLRGRLEWNVCETHKCHGSVHCMY